MEEASAKVLCLVAVKQLKSTVCQQKPVKFAHSLAKSKDKLNMTNKKRAYLIVNEGKNTFVVAHDKATIADILGLTRQAVQALITKDEVYHKKSKSTIKAVYFHKKITNRVGRASNFTK